jgi:hypothetical protein
MDAARFPALAGEALDGTPFAVPRDLAGARTVALVGFALDQRPEVESWGPYLDALVRSRRDVRARLFAVIGNLPKFARGAVLGTMRMALQAPELRASTVPVFADQAAFSRSLGLADRAHLALYLVEPDGTISWRAAGAYSDTLGASLNSALGV